LTQIEFLVSSSGFITLSGKQESQKPRQLPNQPSPFAEPRKAVVIVCTAVQASFSPSAMSIIIKPDAGFG
jgi:hypothetical protein